MKDTDLERLAEAGTAWDCWEALAEAQSEREKAKIARALAPRVIHVAVSVDRSEAGALVCFARDAREHVDLNAFLSRIIAMGDVEAMTAFAMHFNSEQQRGEVDFSSLVEAVLAKGSPRQWAQLACMLHDKGLCAPLGEAVLASGDAGACLHYAHFDADKGPFLARALELCGLAMPTWTRQPGESDADAALRVLVAKGKEAEARELEHHPIFTRLNYVRGHLDAIQALVAEQQIEGIEDGDSPAPQA